MKAFSAPTSPCIPKQTTTVQVLGLWGMGGIGKTTLAAKLFNSVQPDLDAACFLRDVRSEASLARGPDKLQKRLLRVLTGTHVSVEDVKDVEKGLPATHLVSAAYLETD